MFYESGKRWIEAAQEITGSEDFKKSAMNSAMLSNRNRFYDYDDDDGYDIYGGRRRFHYKRRRLYF